MEDKYIPMEATMKGFGRMAKELVPKDCLTKMVLM